MSDKHERTIPSSETHAEEASDAQVRGGDATESDPRRGDQESKLPAAVADAVGEHYREMTEHGAHQQGEGRVE